MLRNKKLIGMLTVVVLVAIGTWVAAAGALVEQRSVLTGQVLSVVDTGTAVREGNVLVVVGTITGPVPAVRATVDGVVRQVMVKPGDVIHQGQVAVAIEPVRK